MSKVKISEVFDALLTDDDILRRAMALRVKAHGIAPPDNMNLEMRFGLGLCVVDTGEFNGRPAVIVQPSDNAGKVGSSAENEPVRHHGNIVLTFPEKAQMKLVADALVNCIAPPDGIDWKELYRIQTAMRYMDANSSISTQTAFLMADTDIRSALSANAPKPEVSCER